SSSRIHVSNEGLQIDQRYFLFFFQAEDGIRDFHVTGVQTCALPIYFGRVVAAATIASPTSLTEVRRGTATLFKCMPIIVCPISIPAWAWTSSTTTGSAILLNAYALIEPPALANGITETGSHPYFSAACRSTVNARLMCSQP